MIRILFDKRDCGRCGGSGRYSFNMMDGDRCYGCGGSGKVYTKDGAKAYDIFLKSLQIPLDELKVGDQVLVEFMGKRFRKVVLSIGPVKHMGSSTVNGVTTQHYGREVEYKDLVDHVGLNRMVQLGFNFVTLERALAALEGVKGCQAVHEDPK